WFITAGAAFILCFIVVLAMYFGGLVVAIALAVVAVILLIRSNIRYNKKSKEEQTDDLFQRIMASKDRQETFVLLRQHIARNEEECMIFVAQMYQQITDGFIHEELRTLRRACNSMKNRKRLLKSVRRKELIGMRRIAPSIAIEKNTWFHLATNSCQQILYSLMRINEPIQEHVDNHFLPLPKERIDEFLPLRDELMHLFDCTQFLLARGDYAEVDTLREECDILKDNLSRLRKQQMDRMQDVSENLSVSYVYLNLLQESQEIVSSLRHLLRAARNFQAA
ncbi:MAG: inorganic phosphate transporter, partial [Bacteroides sp.]